MKFRWIRFISGRYLKTRNKNRQSTSSLVSLLGVAVGTATLITVMAVMNGLQLGYIENILEVNSNHLRIEVPAEEDPSVWASRLAELPGIESASPFLEAQTIIKGRYSSSSGCFLRGVDPYLRGIDSGFREHTEMVRGTFDLESPESIVLGEDLAVMLGVRVGDAVTLTSLAGETFQMLSLSEVEFTVTGIFRCGYYEYDSTLGFISTEACAAYFSGSEPYQIGIKLDNRNRDREAVYHILGAYPQMEDSIVSWRTYNSAFFEALRFEKVLMYLVVGLIFIVVGVNIYQTMRRNVMEKRDDIGILRALGATPLEIRMIFVFEGLLSGWFGGFAGLLVGLLASLHIGRILIALQNLLQSGIGLFRQLLGLPGVVIRTFYAIEVPVRMVFPEILAVFLFALCATTLSAFLASAPVSRFKPLEVLRYSLYKITISTLSTVENGNLTIRLRQRKIG